MLGFTGCSVSPAASDNLIAFRVLTSTYRLAAVTYQEWGWQDSFNGFHTFWPEQIPLPNNNCPASEVTQ